MIAGCRPSWGAIRGGGPVLELWQSLHRWGHEEPAHRAMSRSGKGTGATGLRGGAAQEHKDHGEQAARGEISSHTSRGPSQHCLGYRHNLSTGYTQLGLGYFAYTRIMSVTVLISIHLAEVVSKPILKSRLWTNWKLPYLLTKPGIPYQPSQWANLEILCLLWQDFFLHFAFNTKIMKGKNCVESSPAMVLFIHQM